MHGVPAKPHSLIMTKEHRRYVEFANAVRKNRTIGLCYSPAGIGKTVSALHLSNWNVIAPELGTVHWDDTDAKTAAACARSGTVFHTARVGAGWRQLRDELGRDMFLFGRLVSRDIDIRTGRKMRDASPVELVLIDEVERLSAACLEWIRDEFDRNAMGVILTGMSGIEKRLSRYPQLYSRVGFAHEYRPLQEEELVFVLQRHWKKLGLELNEDEFTDAQAIAAIVRVTSGNFRLLQLSGDTGEPAAGDIWHPSTWDHVSPRLGKHHKGLKKEGGGRVDGFSCRYWPAPRMSPDSNVCLPRLNE